MAEKPLGCQLMVPGERAVSGMLHQTGGGAPCEMVSLWGELLAQVETIANEGTKPDASPPTNTYLRSLAMSTSTLITSNAANSSRRPDPVPVPRILAWREGQSDDR